ncbi:MAG: PEP-CTERM system histidine kinase PrsK [Gammaproteobacteria bacterium]|nr:PEP-CTERM system histidine kinase PrsK [Gammaproteobacteria bacterium]
MNLVTTGYFISSGLFSILALLLLTHWRGRLQGGLLLLVVILTVIWSLVAGLNGFREGVYYRSAIVIEILRNITLYVFLFGLLRPLYIAKQRQNFYRMLYITVYLGSLLFLLASVYINYGINIGPYFITINYKILFAGNLGMAIIGMILVEQLFRNTRVESRWAIKFLFFGIGLIFIYDFIMYADALLFSQIDKEIWIGRGYVVAMAVPLLALAAQRNPTWSLEVFVSKQLVFHSATLVGIGLYLLLMALAGYYIKLYGGSWGAVAQIVFLSMAFVFLFVAIFSGDLRSKIKVFINKHFFNYKYDYRDEWINITRDLSRVSEESSLHITVINSITSLIESTGGMLWLHDEKKTGYQVVANTLFSEIKIIEPVDSDFADYLHKKDWIIDLREVASSPEKYQSLVIPEWLKNQQRAWLVIPLRHVDELYGFLVLAESRAFKSINWEDRDLLKTACLQATSYLAFQEASNSLAKSEKFAVFNRLSAFVVHDLKNLIAQLELITRNAEKYKSNPEFVDDAFDTVKHASEKMGRLLTQLKQGRFSDQVASVINIQDAMQEIVRSHQIYMPHPQLQCAVENVRISANYDRFLSIVGHIVKNAQEATNDDGYVKVDVSYDDNMLTIKVTDNGSGMDEQFIKDKLFTPFITTKGNAGMGVGVYECREFIEALGGHVQASSKPGHGSEFLLTIPAKRQQDELS